MKILITGGAGFIGSNCVAFFTGKGHQVTVFDNLSRVGTEKNIAWLKQNYRFKFFQKNIVEQRDVDQVFKEDGPYDLILHLAAQVAVTTSVNNPREDFNQNALGTFNMLEATRRFSSAATFIYASTNKVYGEMSDHKIGEQDERYKYLDLPFGINEFEQLDFHSPYGCSKGAADQYCMDYSRIYGLNTIVMRQSCIYGYRQFGVEDQGWVAWFCIAAILEKQITIYGNGKQVRDILFIDDLINAYEMAYDNTAILKGKVFNIGGGPTMTLSLLELLEYLKRLLNKDIHLKYTDWRPGDQKVYISDISLAKQMFGWEPITDPEKGVQKLFHWIHSNKELFE